MNRPTINTSFDAPIAHHHIPTTAHPSTPNPMYNPPYESTSPPRSVPPPPNHDPSRRNYEQLPPVHGLPYGESHLHLPAVSTYIQHYHYYNFNGNCTVQQASSEGGPNTIRMVGASVHQGGSMPPPQGDPPPSRPVPSVEIPPVPPPVQDPLSRNRPPPPCHYPSEPPARPDQDKLPGHSASASYGSLPSSQLPPFPGSSRAGPVAPSSSPLSRHSPFMTGTRLGHPPGPRADSHMLPSTPSSLLPRMRGSFDPGGPISLAPLQSEGMATLRMEEGTLREEQPLKRSRISRSMQMPLPGPDIARRHSHGTSGVGKDIHLGDDEQRNAHARDTAPHPTVPASQSRHGNDHLGPNANSSSPSHGEYQMSSGRVDGFDRADGVIAPTGSRTRAAEETQVNDWEAVVDMYNTGRGTEDGVALKLITKGDGRRVSDRKLLEKRRTIGKTHEILGAERFEAAIGYKWENGTRRKQKMYHVISRCRVVNAMRKANEPIPTDHAQLTAIIDERIAQKEALKEAGKTGAPIGPVLTNGAGPSGSRSNDMGYDGMGAGPSNAGGGTTPPAPGGLRTSINGTHNGPGDNGEEDMEREGMRERRNE